MAHASGKSKQLIKLILDVAVRKYRLLMTISNDLALFLILCYIVLYVLFCGWMVANYSEYMGKTFLINAPFIFQAIWAFVKNMLDAE